MQLQVEFIKTISKCILEMKILKPALTYIA